MQIYIYVCCPCDSYSAGTFLHSAEVVATNIYGFAESICIMVFMGHAHPLSACRLPW